MRTLLRAACLALAALAFFVNPRGGTAVVRAAAPGTFGDFDGDGKADFAVLRPDLAPMWHIQGQEPLQWGLPGDIPVVGDYDGNGVADIAVYRKSYPSSSKWFIRGQTTRVLAVNGSAIPVPADYDGDGRTDIAVFQVVVSVYRKRVTTWRWTQTGPDIPFGLPGDKPMPADVDGDGKADLIVYRPSAATWFTTTAASNYTAVTTTPFGRPGDVPLVGDVEGDGRADLMLFRPALGRWFVVGTAQGSFEVTFGALGDVPLLADVTGDGALDFCVWTPVTGTWHVFDRAGTGAITTTPFGELGDLPALERPRRRAPRTADFDGDGLDDLSIYRDVAGVGYWYQRFSASDPVFSVNGLTQWGLGGDVKMPGDYDGDRKTDYAVFRPYTGMWYLKLSTDTTREIQWGLPGDIPLSGDSDGDGRTDPIVFRPLTNEWFALLSGSGFAGFNYAVFGAAGFVTPQPFAADMDGDTMADLVMWQPRPKGTIIVYPTWHMRMTTNWDQLNNTATHGALADVPLMFDDADGDGRADLALYRGEGYWDIASGAGFYLSQPPPTLPQFGLAGDTPVPHDYDGDGITDLAVWRPENGTWYVRQSSNGALLTYQWGLSGDQPVLRIQK